MRTTLYAQVAPSMLQYIRKDIPLEQALMTYASFSQSKSENYVQLGSVEIDIEIDTDHDSLVQKAVAGLRMEQADIRAKAQKEANAVEHKINQLLAIENKPSAPDALGEIVEEFKELGNAPDA